MRTSVRLGWFAAFLFGFGACTSGGSSTDGNTTWLKLCTKSADCTGGMSCSCGLCTQTCSSESACADLGSGAACVTPNLLGAACSEPSLGEGPVCMKLCVSVTDCPAPLSCRSGVCAPAPNQDAGGSGGHGGVSGASAGGNAGGGAGGTAEGGGASTGGGAESGGANTGDSAESGGASAGGDGSGGARSDAGSGGASGSSTADGGAAGGAGGGAGDAATGTGSEASVARDAGPSDAVVGDAGPAVVASVAAGLFHACAIVNGGAQCWGRNDEKQLGNVSVGDYSTVPVEVTGLDCGVSGLCAGLHHTCAIVRGGVQCWGGNDKGQLGNSTVTGATSVPVPVAGLTNVDAIACGRDHTCALRAGGVTCWGDNSYNQLGSTGVQSEPRQVQGLNPGSGVTAISANGHGTCAIVNGGLECWGDDTYGQLGNGVGGVTAFVPFQPSGLATGVSSVAVGDGEQICAALNGAVQCSGKAFYDVSGFPSEKHTFTALPKPFDSGVQALSAGYEFSCAVVNGAALCWGDSSVGQLGGTQGPYVLGLDSGVQSIATGEYFACAIMNGSVWCWGWDMDGQLARGRVVGVTMAQPVTGLRAIPSCPYNHCLDHQLNGGETGTDCGGECPACVLGKPCAVDGDCISNACDALSLKCVSVYCNDHHQDADETDSDCGGPNCAPCANGKKCGFTFDCASGFCSAAHVCE